MICSMVIEATVRRSWPRMISSAIFSMSSIFRPSSLCAAFCMILSWMLMPMVKVLGTLILMFWRDSASFRSMLMVIGVRGRYA